MAALKDVVGPRLADGGVPRPVRIAGPTGSPDPITAALQRQRQQMAVELEREEVAAQAEYVRARRLQARLDGAKAEVALAQMSGNGQAGGNEVLGQVVGYLVEQQKAAAEQTAGLHAQLLGSVQAQVQTQIEALRAEVAKSANGEKAPGLSGIIGQVTELRQLAELILPGSGGRSVDETVALARLESERAVQLQQLQLEAEDRTERRRLDEARVAGELARAAKLGDLVEKLGPGLVQMFAQNMLGGGEPAGIGGGQQPAPLGDGRAEHEQQALGTVVCPNPSCGQRFTVPPGAGRLVGCPTCRGVIDVQRDRPDPQEGRPGAVTCRACGGEGILSSDGRMARCARCGTEAPVRWS